MFCKSCTYDLAGAPEPRCPECGRAFDPANPRTYLRTLAWRRRRPWILAAAAILVLYAIAPRGYVKGVAVLNSGGTGTRFTQYRLAPPRWLWKVPYPHWTFEEPDPSAAASPDGNDMCNSRLERIHWFRVPEVVASVSIIDLTIKPGQARAALSTQVRRQCQGYTGVWMSNNDSTIPEYMLSEKDPW